MHKIVTKNESILTLKFPDLRYIHIQLYERRRKVAKRNELQYWDQIGPQYMSEESTVEDEEVFVRKHTPIWRSSGKP